MTEKERSDLRALIAEALAERGSGTARFITLAQAVVTGSVSFIGLMVTIYVSFANLQARLEKVEYQNAISIEDRRDLRARLDKADANEAQINTHLARIDVSLSTVIDLIRRERK